MARDRTHDEILDQMVYAVACVAYHYGPGLSAEGLQWVRKQLNDKKSPWWCDSSWRVDTPEGDGEPNPDFVPAKLRPDLLYESFEEIARLSRGNEEQ